MKYVIAVLSLMLVVGLLTCSDNSPSQPVPAPISISGTVIACNCISICNDIGPYSLLTGKLAKVVIKRDDGLTFSALTNDSSIVRLRVDTGTYQIFTETYHQPLLSYSSIRITGDTTVASLPTELTYDPPDSIQAQFLYGPSDSVWSAQNERGSLDYLNTQMAGIFDFSNIHRSTVFFDDTTWVTYYQLGVRAPVPSWKVESESGPIIARHANRYPPGFRLIGYLHPCPMGY